MTMAYNRRQLVSVLLVLSMVFSMWMSVSPLQPANAGILSSIGNIAKSIFVNVGALAGGAATAVLGAAVGGGPLGMAVGGVAGFLVTKKVLNWTTSSVANFATVAGAIGGGLLCAGMGFPMLAVGVLGGGIVSRLLVKGVSALVKKITGGKDLTVSKAELDEEAAKEETARISAFLDRLESNSSSKSTTENSGSAPVVQDSESAYNNYVAAYEQYVNCVSNGDTEGAKVAYESYRKNMELYQSLLKAGK